MKKGKDIYGKRVVAEVFIPTGKGDEEIPVTAIFDQTRHKNTILKAQSRGHNVGTS